MWSLVLMVNCSESSGISARFEGSAVGEDTLWRRLYRRRLRLPYSTQVKSRIRARLDSDKYQ